jgi:hypothetical protein
VPNFKLNDLLIYALVLHFAHSSMPESVHPAVGESKLLADRTKHIPVDITQLQRSAELCHEDSTGRPTSQKRLTAYSSGWRKPLVLVTPQNRRELASIGVSFVLGMRLKIQTSRRTAACQQRGSPFIFRMVTENPNWGAPRIHGELLTLGFDLSERSVWRWIRRALRDPDPLKRWLTFIRNHREAIAAMGFFTVRPSSIELTVQGYRWISGRTKQH